MASSEHIHCVSVLPPGHRRQRGTKEREGKQNRETRLPSLGKIKKAPVAPATIAHQEQREEGAVKREKKISGYSSGCFATAERKRTQIRAREERPGLSEWSHLQSAAAAN